VPGSYAYGGYNFVLALPGGDAYSRRIPASLITLPHFAASARQNSGDLIVAHQLWSQVRANSPNPLLRDIAARELERIEQAIATGRRDLAVRHMSTPGVQIR